MLIIYIDIILLIILLVLICVTCGYCVYRVHQIQQSGQVAIILKPTKVLFSHRKDENSSEQLRTAVAYQNPFTGDYCVHKSREPKGYLNSAESMESTDSGVSDEYEPLNIIPLPKPEQNVETQHEADVQAQEYNKKRLPLPRNGNTVNKTWKWNYTEYQI